MTNATNTIEVTPDEAIEIGKLLIAAGEDFGLIGAPGVGKTTIARTAALAVSHKPVLVHPTTEEPIDAKGLAMGFVNDGVAKAQFISYGNLAMMESASEPTVVVLDDFGQATNAMQAAYAPILLERHINGKTISPFVRFVMTTNRRQDKAGVSGILSMVLDRFTTVFYVKMDLECTTKYMLQRGYPMDLISYIRYDGYKLMENFEPSRNLQKSPTPRSVERLGKLVKTGNDLLLSYPVVAGAVGEPFAAGYLGFRKIFKKIPDRNMIYLNPDTAPIPEEADALYALMGTLAHGANEQNVDALVRYLNRFESTEFPTKCIKDATYRDMELMNTHAIQSYFADHKEIFGFNL